MVPIPSEVLAEFPKTYRDWRLALSAAPVPTRALRVVTILGTHQMSALCSRIAVDESLDAVPTIRLCERHVQQMIDKWHETGEMPPMERFPFDTSD